MLRAVTTDPVGLARVHELLRQVADLLAPAGASLASALDGVEPPVVRQLGFLRDHLPPLVPRGRVADYLPGVVTAKDLANLDCVGKGPRVRVALKGRVAYPREYLLEWLETEKLAQVITRDVDAA